jgi:hypothetical protein
MPSLIPGMPGTKEVYGISIIREDLSITIPPKAKERYKIVDSDTVVLVTSHRSEGGFGLMKKEIAEKQYLKNASSRLVKINTIYWFNDKAYILTNINETYRWQDTTDS